MVFNARPVRASWFSKYVPLAGSGCVLFCPMQDDQQKDEIKDISGKRNNGTISGATWTRLPSGLWCLSFDGSNDSVDCGDDVSLDITTQLTLLIWVSMQEAIGDTHFIMGRDDGTNRNYHLVINNSGYTQFLIRIGNSSKFKQIIDTYVQDTWYLMGGTYDGSELKVYRISSSGTSVGVLTGLSGLIDNDNVSFYIGARPNGQYPAHAYISLPRVYSTVLTQAQLEYIFLLERHLFKV